MKPNSGALDRSMLVVESGVLTAEKGVPFCGLRSLTEFLTRDSEGGRLWAGVLTGEGGLLAVAAASSAASFSCKSRVIFWTQSCRAVPKCVISCWPQPSVRSSQNAAPNSTN